MALITPSGIPIAAFDATQPQTFQFIVNGGDQVVGNKLTIINNATGDLVYEKQIASFVYAHTVYPNDPNPNVMTNDGYYTFSFQTVNANGVLSAPSTPIAFRTYTQPTLTLTNFPSTHIIQSSNYNFTCEYNQIENESLKSITFYIYDATLKELDNKTFYNSATGSPVTFNYEYKGFVDNENYYIRVVAYTINNTEIEIPSTSFRVDYLFEDAYFNIEAKNYANGGYVHIYNNVSEIDGEVVDYNNNIVRPTYIGDTYVVLTDNKLYFNEGYQIISNSFVKQKWWFPVRLGTTTLFYNDKTNGEIGDYLSVELKRGLKNNICYDYLEVTQYDANNNIIKRKTSNLLAPLNQLLQVKSFISVIDNDITVELAYANVSSSAEWNGDSTIILDGAMTNLQWLGESGNDTQSYIDIDNLQSNVEWGCLTNMFWADEAQADALVEYDDDTTINSVYYYHTMLANGIINEFYVTRDTTVTMLSTFPTWDSMTIMLCDFNNNVTAGNILWVQENVNKIKLKRKKTNGGQYVTIYEKNITNASDLLLDYRDYFVPSGDNFTYAIVPCIEEDEQYYEKKYITVTIDTFFNGLFISDKDKTLKLYSNYGISSSQDNILLGVVQPYFATYPVIIKNPNVRYRTVTINGDVLGFNEEGNECQQHGFELTDKTRSLIVAEKRMWDEFLCNGKTKIIKDWNGNIMMAQVTTAPSYVYTQQSGNSIPNMSLGVTEVGQYDSQSDLYKHGLTNAQV